MIFESRAHQPPSAAVVSFRDRLEEATAIARENRGTATTPTTVAQAAPVASPEVMPATAATTTVTASQPVVPADEAPARTESLPPSP